jgi:hypothetical protein
MKQAIVRWTFYLAAFFLIGPLAAALPGGLRGEGGSPGASPLVSTAPALGLLLALAALAIAGTVGAVAARLVGSAAGLTTAGIIAAWAAFRTGTVEALVRAAQSGRPLLVLALEGLLLGIAALAMASLILAAGRPADSPAGSAPDRRFFARGDLAALPVALLGGALGAALIAGSAIKGQTIAAAIVGGIGVGVAARLVSGRAGIPAMFIAIAALAILGPLAGYVMAGGGGGGILQSAYRGSLFPLAWVGPLDWVAGGLLGIPIGIGWAHSLGGGGSAGEKKTA